MEDINSLSHSKWNCKYHIVFAPKYRRKVFFGEKRREILTILGQLCKWKDVAYDKAGNHAQSETKDITLKNYGQNVACGYTYTQFTSTTTNDVAQCTPVAQTDDCLTYTTCPLGNWSSATTSRVDSCAATPKTSDGLTARECVLDSDWTIVSTVNTNSCTISETTTQKIECPTIAWSKSTTYPNECTASGSTNSNTYYVSCTVNGWGDPTSSTYPTSCSKSEGNTSKVTCESGYYKHVCSSTSSTSYNKSSSTCGCGSSCTTSSGYYHKYTYSRKSKYTKVVGTRAAKYNKTTKTKQYTQSDYTRLYNETVYTRTREENVCWY